ncbi:hypothetical protein BJY01DRAFT_250528 [Aspergillus pseudoustus]|uniref:Uncharacterized protein n=1 Tax=Aspergillus pseudoustus TaxID=1810923 RepID=A0ABR4JH34_9EURO
MFCPIRLLELLRDYFRLATIANDLKRPRCRSANSGLIQLRVPHRRRNKRATIPEFETPVDITETLLDDTELEQPDGHTEFATMDEIRLQNRRNRRDASYRMAEITQQLYNLPSSHVEHALLTHLNLVSEKLVLGAHDPGKHSFQPQSVPWVQAHAPDMQDALVKHEADAMERFWPLHDKDSITEMDGADTRGSHLAIEFGQYDQPPRAVWHTGHAFGVDRSVSTFPISSLSYKQKITITRFLRDVNDSVLKSRSMTPRIFAAGENTSALAPWSTEIDSAWIRDLITLPFPNFFRTELLIALGITRTRLLVFKDHEIAPVMLVSCFNGTKARILQVHYTSGRLIVFVSDTFQFHSPEARGENIPPLCSLPCKPAGRKYQEDDTEVGGGTQADLE